jgi:hypothetical protein
MNIKNIIFLTAIISCNISPILQANEETIQKQRIAAQQLVIDSCTKRLEMLTIEEKDQYSHTQYCWYGAVAGIAIIVLGCLNQDNRGGVIGAGSVLVAGSTGLGVASIANENYKADLRRKEKNELFEKLHKLSHK